MPLYVTHPAAGSSQLAETINTTLTAGPGGYWLTRGDDGNRTSIQSGDKICGRLEGILADGRGIASNTVSTVAP